jgi:hypothetical protein
MVYSPFLDFRFRLGPAFQSAFIIKIELNGKMTGRLQVGNVGKKVLFLFEQAEGRGLKYLWS